MGVLVIQEPVIPYGLYFPVRVGSSPDPVFTYLTRFYSSARARSSEELLVVFRACDKGERSSFS